jgi:hypothetical protein
MDVKEIAAMCREAKDYHMMCSYLRQVFSSVQGLCHSFFTVRAIKTGKMRGRVYLMMGTTIDRILVSDSLRCELIYDRLMTRVVHHSLWMTWKRPMRLSWNVQLKLSIL